MARYTTTIESSLTPDEAFAYMADFSNAQEWDPSVAEAKRLGDVGADAAFDLVVRFGGRKLPMRYETAAFDAEQRRVVLQADNPRFTSRDTITVTPARRRLQRSLRRRARPPSRQAARPGAAVALQPHGRQGGSGHAHGAQPVSIRGLVDGALEASVVGSFTRLGYDARRRLYSWTPLEQLQLDGKTAIVTGATSGLGQETATPARSTRGARLRRRARSRPHRERATIATGRRISDCRPLVARRDARVRPVIRRLPRPARRPRAERGRHDA